MVAEYLLPCAEIHRGRGGGGGAVDIKVRAEEEVVVAAGLLLEAKVAGSARRELKDVA